MGDNGMEGCKFLHTSTAVYTEGIMQSLILSENFSDSDENAFLADVIHFKNTTAGTKPMIILKKSKIKIKKVKIK